MMYHGSQKVNGNFKLDSKGRPVAPQGFDSGEGQRAAIAGYGIEYGDYFDKNSGMLKGLCNANNGFSSGCQDGRPVIPWSTAMFGN